MSCINKEQCPNVKVRSFVNNIYLTWYQSHNWNHNLRRLSLSKSLLQNHLLLLELTPFPSHLMLDWIPLIIVESFNGCRIFWIFPLTSYSTHTLWINAFNNRGKLPIDKESSKLSFIIHAFLIWRVCSSRILIVFDKGVFVGPYRALLIWDKFWSSSLWSISIRRICRFVETILVGISVIKRGFIIRAVRERIPNMWIARRLRGIMRNEYFKKYNKYNIICYIY